MKYLLLGILLIAQICPNCFETRWQTRTVAVDCQSSATVKAELEAQGYRVFIKKWKLEETFICDHIGIK